MDISRFTILGSCHISRGSPRSCMEFVCSMRHFTSNFLIGFIQIVYWLGCFGFKFRVRCWIKWRLAYSPRGTPRGHSPTNCCLLIVFQSIFGRIFFANMKWLFRRGSFTIQIISITNFGNLTVFCQFSVSQNRNYTHENCRKRSCKIFVIRLLKICFDSYTMYVHWASNLLDTLTACVYPQNTVWTIFDSLKINVQAGFDLIVHKADI